MTPRRFLLASLLLGALAHTPSADACGGCFHPPETVQVVTDHRMVFMLSRTRTVLWDQFRYSGNPSEFSWILPIRSGVGASVEVADNVFLTAMDDVGAPIVNPAPSPFRCSGGGGGIGCGASADSASLAGGFAPDASSVNVYNEQTLGPYNVATVGSTDPMALRNWLRSNGYVVPDATVPVIDYYVGLRMDFVAVRLRASADISQMRPLRVITPGYNPQLPLRMVSAGVSDAVGIVLTVIADARVEATNYPNGEIANGDLVYDYDNPTNTTDDFLAAFNRLNQRNNNRMWLTESAQTLSRAAVESAIRQRCNPFGGGVTAPGCNQDMPASPSDTEVAFAPFGETAYVTRMRARLGATALDRDLQIASSDRGARSRTYDYGTLRHDPCTTPSTSFEGCSTGHRAPGALYVSGLGALGLAVAARVRRRARTRARDAK